MGTQLRPAGSPPGTPFYSPYRDLANCYPHIIRAALVPLDPAERSESLNMLMFQLGVTDADLADGAAKLAATLNRLFDDESPRTWEQAISESGYDQLPFNTMRLLHSMLGDAFLGATFQAIATSVSLNELPSNLPELGRLIATAVAVANRFQVQVPERIVMPPDPSALAVEVAELKLQLGLARARDAGYEEMLNEGMARIQHLEKQLAELQPNVVESG